MSSYNIKLVGPDFITVWDKSIRSKEPRKERFERWPWRGEGCPVVWHPLPSVTVPSCPLLRGFPSCVALEVGIQSGDKALPFGLSLPSRLWKSENHGAVVVPVLRRLRRDVQVIPGMWSFSQPPWFWDPNLPSSQWTPNVLPITPRSVQESQNQFFSL